MWSDLHLLSSGFLGRTLWQGHLLTKPMKAARMISWPGECFRSDYLNGLLQQTPARSKTTPLPLRGRG